MSAAGLGCPWRLGVAGGPAAAGLQGGLWAAWRFGGGGPGGGYRAVRLPPQPAHGTAPACREVYDKASPGYKGRCTAPMLIDKKVGGGGCGRAAWLGSASPGRPPAVHCCAKPGCCRPPADPPCPAAPRAQTRRIVANSSPDIVRMLNDMNPPGSSGVDLCPPQLTAAIDAMNDRVGGGAAVRSRRRGRGRRSGEGRGGGVKRGGLPMCWPPAQQPAGRRPGLDGCSMTTASKLTAGRPTHHSHAVSMRSGGPPISLPPCVLPSRPRSCTAPSRTASTSRASPPARRPTTACRLTCGAPWTRWRGCWPGSASWWATGGQGGGRGLLARLALAVH